MCVVVGMSSWKERKKAKAIFKRLKAGLVSWDDLSQEEFELLEKYYGWMFWKKVKKASHQT